MVSRISNIHSYDLFSVFLDGSYEGTRYFETETNRGLFCRPAKVQRLVQNGANTSGGDTSGSIKAQTTSVADASKLSTTMTDSDKGDADKTLINPPVADTNTTLNDQTVASAEPSSSQELHVGDRVVVSGTKFGTLKYLGKIHVAEGTWCGIQLDEPLGKNDGSVSGKRYFTCQQRYGLFSPLARVEKVTNEMSQSQIIARKESVTSNTNNNRPLHRSTSQESLQSNLSEFSASSNSISRIPTRTPAKMQQQKQAVNANLYTPTNTKSLLTQAAATLAAVTPSSTQISNLVQTIREKDLFIEKLQSQREQDRLEFSRAAQQVDEMESRMLAFKQQYDTKESENEQLKKEQYQSQQRIEDLEFQLEEYKLTDANKEHSTSSTIPEGHRLLSPKDIEIYQEIKEKVLELETINQKLILEKQTLQDEHRQELKRQNEFNENDYKSRLNDFEQKYNNNQTNNIDTIKSEYQTKLNEKDQQITKLLEQKQQEIDQLKSRVSELQTKGNPPLFSLSHIQSFYLLEQTLSEKEASHEQSIKEIQEVFDR
jgi:dynactin complex subunit